MDEKLLLGEVLTFFDLNESSSEEELKANYHKLAKKYHPDSSEYTSDILFQELQRQYEFLKNVWEEKGNFHAPKISENELIKPVKREGNDPIFNIYKLAKEVETKAILSYFEKSKNVPVELTESKNKYLIDLRRALEPARLKYMEIVNLYPSSIWAKDSKDSIQRLSVWWKKDPS